MDLGVIDHNGIQRNYAGPYPVKGMDYSQQEWYKNLGYTDQDNYLDVIAMRSNISDVFLRFRNTPLRPKSLSGCPVDAQTVY